MAVRAGAARRARSLLREILSPTRVKLSELIREMHTLLLKTCLLLDDLEKHVQMNRARFEFVQSPERGDPERFITPRRRRPNGHWCFRQRQGQAEQRQVRQGQRQRQARTARTARTRTARTGREQGQRQEQGFDGMLELWKARTFRERLLEQD